MDIPSRCHCAILSQEVVPRTEAGKTNMEPIGKAAIAGFTPQQKEDYTHTAHLATIKAASQAIFNAVSLKMVDEGLKMNEIVMVIIDMSNEEEHARNVIPALIDEENLIQRCTEQRIKTAVFAKKKDDFAKRLFGIPGPNGELNNYNEAAEALSQPLEQDRLQTCVFLGNRCSTTVLRFLPDKVKPAESSSQPSEPQQPPQDPAGEPDPTGEQA